MLDCGIIGCGNTGEKNHAPAIDDIGGLNLQWVCDPDEERAKRVGQAFGAEVYTNTEEALNDIPDIVHICTPPQIHMEQAIDAMEAGANVLVEKPVAMEVDEVLKMKEVSSETGNKLGVVHNNRFIRPMRSASKEIRQGEFGDIVAINSYLGRERTVEENRQWVSALHGGTIGEHIPHTIYLVTDFIGDLENISVDRFTDEDETVRAGIQVKADGALGHIHADRTAPPGKTVEIIGTKKQVKIDIYRWYTISNTTMDMTKLSMVTDNLGSAGELVKSTFEAGMRFLHYKLTDSGELISPGHYPLIEQFKDAVENDTEPPVTIDEGLKVVKVLNELQNSSN